MQFLNLENIRKSTDDVEYHPLKPFLPENCKVLFLGSFPPPRNRWCMDFFYPNFINDHWRIEGLLFFQDKDHFVDAANKTFRLPEIVRFLTEKGIGFFDTATAVRRLKGNASDDFLEVVEPTDLPSLLRQVPQCRVVVTTGEKATRTLCERLHIPEIPKVGHYSLIPTTAASFTADAYAAASGTASVAATVDAVSEADVPAIAAIPEGLTLYRLPSSSRAYPLSLEKKTEAYREMFRFAGML